VTITVKVTVPACLPACLHHHHHHDIVIGVSGLMYAAGSTLHSSIAAR
jgi:hypothetical protein